MKKKLFSWSAIVFTAIAAALLLSACKQVTDSDTEPFVDSPIEGAMTKSTADAIFGKSGWEYTADKKGAAILKFEDADALAAYLTDKRQAAGAADLTLKIGTIEGKPVVKIAEKAFAPNPELGDKGDITRIIIKIELPNTIEYLGKNLFEGAAVSVTLDIPQTAPVIVKIIEEKRVAAEKEVRAELADSGATEEEIAAKVEEAVEKATEEAFVEVKDTLNAAAGTEAGIEIVSAPEPAGPSDPAAPAVPLPPPEKIKEPGADPDPAPVKPDTPNQPDQPSTSSNTPNSSTPVSPPPAPAGVPSYKVTDLNLSGKVTAPVKGAAPVTTFSGTDQYTGTIVWQTALG